ncbi:MAG TPA: hypothetical protein VIJ04_06495 [Xanthobacteraceae bacterium]
MNALSPQFGHRNSSPQFPAYGPKDRHWAYGTVGVIVGFWFG